MSNNTGYNTPEWFNDDILLKKFIVEVTEVHYITQEVMAKSLTEAKRIVSERIANREIDYRYLTYSHTLPETEWLVYDLDSKKYFNHE